MDSKPVLKLALLGSATLSEDSAEGERARSIGRVVGEKGIVLLTGGCPGLPHAAVLGAKDAGGITVAVSPAGNGTEHSERYGYPLDSDVMIFTGMGTKGRNVVLVRSADACLFVTGGIGTLNEFTIACDELGHERAIGILDGSEGLTSEFPRLISLTDRPPRAHLVQDADPRALVERLMEHCSRFVR